MHRVLPFVLTLATASFAFALGAPSVPSGVVAADGVAYFTFRNGVCRTDATAAGTRCFPLPDGPFGEPALLNGTLYTFARWYGPARLYAFDGEHPPRQVMQFGAKEWVRDLTTNGTHLFYFSMFEIPDGVHLMRTDGTTAGTSRVKLLLTDRVDFPRRAGNSVLFRVRYTEEWTPRWEFDWWTTDGTRDGTTPLLPRDAFPLLSLGGAATLFSQRGELWRTDGTATGTFLLMKGWRSTPVTVRDGVSYFTVARQVWRTDGATATPLRKVDFDPALTGVAGSRLLFLQKQQNAMAVWSADETYGSPQVLATIPGATPDTTAAPAIAHLGSLAFFTIVVDGHRELWRSDGTPGGTFRVARWGRFTYGTPRFTPLGDRLLFFLDDGVHGEEPWVSDGTVAGTFLLANLAPEGTIRGRVTDAGTGLPLANAVVELPHDPLAPVLRTDADGRYTFEGAIGTLTVRAHRDTHLAASRDVKVAANEDVTVDFALQLGARIAGRVTDTAGKPLPRISVKIEGGGASLTSITGEDGRYDSGLLTPGIPWAVTAETQQQYNRSFHPDGVRLEPGETRNVDLAMTPFGRLRIRLIDAVTRGPLHTNSRGSVGIHYSATRFYDWGRFAPPSPYVEVALPDGEYQVHSAIELYRSAWYEGDDCPDGVTHRCSETPRLRRGKRLRINGNTMTEIDFVLRPIGASLRGVVLDAETGARVSGVTIIASNAGGREAWAHSRDGSFETEPVLRDGRHAITTTHDSESPYLPAQLEKEIRFDADPRPYVEVRLTRGGTLYGRVVDAKGEPLWGARLAVEGRDDPRSADRSGRYAIPALPTGTYILVVSAQGHEPVRIEGISITAGQKTKVDVTMK